MGWWDDVQKQVGAQTGFNYEDPFGQGGIAGLKNPLDPIGNKLTGWLQDTITPTGGDGPQGAITDATRKQSQQRATEKTIEDLKKESLGYAGELETEGFQEGVFRPVRAMRLRELAQQNKATTGELGKRGLLYGGIAQGRRSQDSAKASDDLSGLRSDITTKSAETAQDIRDDVLNQGFKQRQTQQALYDNIYQSTLQDYMNRKKASSDFLGAVGGVVGTVYGGPAGGAAGYAGGSAAGNAL